MPLHGPTIDTDSAIVDARAKALDSVVAGLALIGLFGPPISASRAFITGWMDIYTLHIIIGIAAIGLWLFRRQIPTNVKLAVLIVLMWGIGLFGLLNYGLLSAGSWWLATSALVTGMVAPRKVAMRVSIAAVLAMVAIAGGFITGGLYLEVGLSAYMSSPTAWATFFIAAVCLPLIVFSVFLNQSRLVTELARQADLAQKALREYATIDPLTGALRPAMMEDRIEYAMAKARRARDMIGVMFIDLDNFKPINDHYGHAAGDAILTEFSKRIRGALREEDFIARVGGDEFVVVITGLSEEQQALLVARKIRGLFKEPVAINDTILRIGFSTGIAVGPAEGDDPKSLIRTADKAMYAAKRTGTNRICLGVPPHHHVAA